MKQFCKRLKLILCLAFLLTQCDPEGKKNCDWTLEPEPSLKGQSQDGFIPVCARNRVTMKQDCRFQTKLDYAKNIYGKNFKYIDIEVESPALPRTITKIKLCL